MNKFISFLNVYNSAKKKLWPTKKIDNWRLKRLSFLTKRHKFVIISVILTIGLLVIQLIHSEYRDQSIFLLASITYLLFIWGLYEDVTGIEWLTLFMLPVLFVIAVSYFYFLLPARWLIRIPVILIFFLGIYALALTENIFNVAAERNIQLLRAAHSVGFLITTITAFLFYNLIFSFHINLYYNFLLVFLITLFLSFQSLWSMKLTNNIEIEVLMYSLIISLVNAQLAFVLSFWPVKTTIEALFATSFFYTLIGITQQYLVGRMFKKTIREFLLVLSVTFIMLLLTTRWGGVN